MSRLGWAFAAAAFAFGFSSQGCLDVKPFECTADIECLVDGVQGSCVTSSSSCVYPADACPSRWADGEGVCVSQDPFASGTSGVTMTTSDDTTTTSAGPTGDTRTTSESMTTEPSTTTMMATTDPSTTTDPTDADTTVGEPCGGAASNITDEGSVGASSVFMNFNPPLSVDGDLSTSWFSSGPEPGDMPSTYTWQIAADRCLARVLFFGNGGHENPDFQEGFGYDSMTVRVFSASNDIVFEESFSLSGTPDPDLNIDLEGVDGSRVVLELSDHEDDSCGGFAELQVFGEQ